MIAVDISVVIYSLSSVVRLSRNSQSKKLIETHSVDLCQVKRFIKVDLLDSQHCLRSH